ncbi:MULTISPECIES: hypothetical protein [Cyanophyceae]|uniref:hypothetical protein n=1 Tax=Cyanophyceae TaxID=3028117 RepID=UPI0016873044|nr:MULTISPECIES: hypothetical protein [Cyanophyceae]MBD1914685.1 hypothetical protein [Phormidium sp. FACHB-77]MBD2032573.1 hypothetical protein [Phormidium sp. FACHB-322]MBD2049431.1 hypothetical protein [Leptolyngbya sp. FACHB-60]
MASLLHKFTSWYLVETVPRGVGCYEAQGYLYSRPVNPEAVLDFLGSPRPQGSDASLSAGAFTPDTQIQIP